MCRLFRYAVGLTLLLSSLVSNAHGQAGDQRRPLEWRTLVIVDFGTRVDYPASIFTQTGKSKVGTGQQFERADGGATLSVYSRPNVSGETPRTYLRNNLRMERSALDYVRTARSFFAISSEREGVILYSRCNFSGGAHGVVHCFDLMYPQAEKRAWDPIVTRISLSLRPLETH
jgi:hypothetical protein